MGVFILGNLAAGFSRSIGEVIVFRGSSPSFTSLLVLITLVSTSANYISGFAGAGGGGIVSMAQIVMSDVVSLRDRCVEPLSPVPLPTVKVTARY